MGMLPRIDVDVDASCEVAAEESCMMRLPSSNIIRGGLIVMSILYDKEAEQRKRYGRFRLCGVVACGFVEWVAVDGRQGVWREMG